MQPTVSNRPVVAALLNGAKIQVRNVTGSVRNTFTVDTDVGDPDSNGVFTIGGAWAENPLFVNCTNYGLYFSQNRPHVIPDDVTLELTDDNRIQVKAGGIRDEHIAEDLTDNEQTEAQNRLGITPAWGGQISIDHVDISAINTGAAARWALQTSGTTHYLRFEDLTDRDQRYVESWQVGTKLGFYNGSDEADRATVEAGWDATNRRVQIGFDTTGALSSSVDYDIRVSQYRLELPPDGADGQILAKASANSYDTEWINAPTGSGTQVSGNRGESITLQASTGGNITDTGRVISPVAGASAISVRFPSSGGESAEMIGQGDNADGFEILQAGIYQFVVRGAVTAVTHRTTPTFQIFEYDADIATADPIGELDNPYIRYEGSSHNFTDHGLLEVNNDNMQVKLVAINAFPDAGQPGTDDGAFTLNANAVVSIYRTGVKGERGSTGPAGAMGTTGATGATGAAGEAGAAGQGVPAGGSEGQILAKASDNDYDGEWVDPAEDVDTFHLTVERRYVTGTPTASNDITIVQHSCDVYNVGVNRHMGVNVLPENYIDALPRDTEIRIATPNGSTEWNGELDSIHDETDTGAILRILFGDRTGTFTNNETVEVSFAYAPARIPRSSEIEIEGDLDGTLDESDTDLESHYPIYRQLRSERRGG